MRARSPAPVANACYTLTDRATFDFLQSKNSPSAGSTGIPNLSIIARDNSASAPGGANALINYFHIYIINPDKPGETVNLTAAQDFMDFITSPVIQSELKGYLTGTPGDNGTPVFVATASPKITASGFPSTITAGKTVDGHRGPHPAPGGLPGAGRPDGEHQRARGAHERPGRQREDRCQRQLQHHVHPAVDGRPTRPRRG